MPIYDLKIKTISPVHIGDGGVYDGMTLLEVNRDFYPINYASIAKAFEVHKIPKIKYF